MELSRGAIKKECIRVSDTYTTITPILRMVQGQGQINQELRADKDSDGESAKKARDNADLYARSIIDRAKSDAISIIEKAKAESEEIKKREYETARKEGYEEGFKKGHDESIKQSQDLREEAENVLEEAHRVSREYIDNRKEEIVTLAIGIAEKIIGYKCSLDDEVIKRIINDSINSCAAKKQLIIRVNPMDYAPVDCRRDEILKIMGEKVILNIVRDNSIKRGGCRLESESCFVDADIDSQLEKIKQALLVQNV